MRLPCDVPRLPGFTGGVSEYGTAVVSECGRYRYRLERAWAPEDEGRAVFVMLNPSTADHFSDDPTIRRCRGFATAWRLGGLVVVNLFAYRATAPSMLLRVDDPVGPDNIIHLRDAVASCRAGSHNLLVFAWGALGTLRDRARAARAIADEYRAAPFTLGLTKGGHPRHPLYVPAAQPLLPLPADHQFPGPAL